MDKRLQIGLVIFMAFAISFYLIYSYLQVYHELTITDKQYDKIISQADSQKKKIVIIGASSVAMLNVTHIDQKLIETEWYDYEVYKLTRDGDRPTQRILDIEELFYLKPEIIFYGVGMREFGYNLFSPGLTQCIPINQNSLVELENKFTDKLQKDEDAIGFIQKLFTYDYFNSLDEIKSSISENVLTVNMNHLEDPKLVTVFFLEKLFSQNTTDVINEGLIEDIDLKKQEGVAEISSTENLEKKTNGLVLGYCKQVQDEEFKSLSEIIQKLEEKNIKIVLFTAPYSGPFLEKFSDVGIRHYFLNLQNLAKDNGINVYSFLERYSDREIFYDLTHVSKTPEGNIFSEEFSEFVIATMEDFNGNSKTSQVSLEKFRYDKETGSNLENLDFHGEDFSEYIFKNSNLKNANFSKLDLSNQDMRFSNLAGSDLSFTSLKGANLEGANLIFANLTGSNLSLATFSGSNLDFADLRNVNISNTDFSYSIMSQVNFANLVINNTSFAGTTLFNSDFSNSQFISVDFSSADLSLSNFSESTFEDVMFSGAHLINADFTSTDLSGMDFSRADLDGANFTNSILSSSIFDYAQMPFLDLSGLDLQHARLIAINLQGSNLENSDLSNSTAQHAFLDKSNLVNANLSNSDFSAASFVNADLSGANLTNTNLRFANFTAANLTGADLRCFGHPICVE